MTRTTARRHALRQLGALGLGSVVLSPQRLWAASFLSIEQAQQALLPQAERFEAQTLTLTDATLDAIGKAADTRVPRNFAPQCWRAVGAGGKTVGWFFADRVIGKTDLIDLAAGFDADGAVLGLEIMAYRESHGAEIRQAGWRRQFSGRKGAAQMRFGDDIRNVSGATLSCQHVTEGMQRLSALVSLLVAGK